MNTNTKLDRYGLTPEDEFYDSNLIQVSDDGAVDVKPFTNSLMTWWKCRMNQQDSIDISEDGNNSILKTEITLNGGDPDICIFTSEDEIDVDSIIEVSEDIGLVNHFIYIQKPIPQELSVQFASDIMNINTELVYGHFEIYTTKESKEQYLRFRENIILKGISVGKVNTIENLYNFSYAYYTVGLNLLCDSNKEFSNWLLQ
jgi:hypothetical protein